MRERVLIAHANSCVPAVFGLLANAESACRAAGMPKLESLFSILRNREEITAMFRI